MHRGLDDTALMAGIASGDSQAFDAFVTRHQSGVFRFARAMLPSDQEAEDVLQETFIALFRGAAGFDGRSTPRTWLFGIARNSALKSLRRRAGQPPSMEPLHALEQAAGWSQSLDPEAWVGALEDRQRLENALAALDPAEREILLLRDVEQLSGAETAEALGVSLAAMKSRLHRARLRLMSVLRPEGRDEL